jgi:hypothetical protein
MPVNAVTHRQLHHFPGHDLRDRRHQAQAEPGWCALEMFETGVEKSRHMRVQAYPASIPHYFSYNPLLQCLL